jgi:hypothetical protein
MRQQRALVQPVRLRLCDRARHRRVHLTTTL